MSVDLLINRCIKWISESICVSCLSEDPGWSSTSKRHHPSHVHMLDRHLHSDRAAVAYIAQQRDRIKRQRHQKAAKNFILLIFFTFSSFHFCLSNLSSPTTPNHQPSRLACHCWVSHSSSEGPQTFFFSLSLFFSLLLGNLPFHQSTQESPVS